MNEFFEPDDLFPAQDYEFSLEFPDYLPEDAFIPHFDPQNLAVWQEGELKTTLIIYSNIPKDMELPENVNLRVNITKYLTAGNVYLPPRGNRGLNSIIWFINSISGSNPFGRLYSGKRTPEPPVYVDIIVKLNRFHLANIKPTSNVEIGPDELISIPIEIENLGSHIDCFNFKINSDSELIISPPTAITLGPNEIGHASIGVASPHIFNDPGTSHLINIEAYSIYDTNSVFTNTVTVISRGIYISEIVAIYSAIFITIVVLFIAILLLRRRRILSERCKKPEKPWSIPEEKKYLENLKEKDKQEYKKVRYMMQDEYKSALLWYNSYRKSIDEKSSTNFRFFPDLLKKLGKDKKSEVSKNDIKNKSMEDKVIFRFFKDQIIKVKSTKQKQKEEKRRITIRLPVTKKSKKEKTLLKIKRIQERQRKKLGKKSYL
jgi:hypothetical protein